MLGVLWLQRLYCLVIFDLRDIKQIHRQKHTYLAHSIVHKLFNKQIITVKTPENLTKHGSPIQFQ